MASDSRSQPVSDNPFAPNHEERKRFLCQMNSSEYMPCSTSAHRPSTSDNLQRSIARRSLLCRLKLPDVVVVVAASIIINIIFGGISSVPGMYIPSFLDTFKTSQNIIAGVVSLQGSLMYLSGSVCGPLITRYGTRSVAVLGSTFASAGYFISAFTQNIVLLYISFGILTGLGFGMLLLANVIAVQQHTSRRNALAAGLVLCGAGIGGVSMPIVVDWSMQTYGWRGSVMVLTGLLLHNLPCGLLLCAPAQVLSPRVIEKPLGNDIKDTDLMYKEFDLMNEEYSDLQTSKHAETKFQSSQEMNEQDKASPMSPNSLKKALTSVSVAAIISWIFYYGAKSVFYTFCTIKATSMGLTVKDSAVILSSCGLADLLGRIAGSVFGSCHTEMPIILHVFNLILSGICMLFIGLSVNYGQMILSVVGFGTTMGLATSVGITALRNLTGMIYFNIIIGLAFTFGGVSNLVAMQIFSFIWEKTNVVLLPHVIGGVFLVMAGGAAFAARMFKRI